MHITDVGRRLDHKDRRAGRGAAKQLLGRITVAGSQTFAPQKTTESVEMHAVWVWTRNVQLTVTVLDGVGISYKKRHL